MMNVESISPQNNGAQVQLSKGSDQLREARKQVANEPQSDQLDKNQIQPEELLQQIKALTEDGVYSVRFENDTEANELVVKVVDPGTDEVIRQIPPEELLDLTKRLNELRGNLVDAEA